MRRNSTKKKRSKQRSSVRKVKIMPKFNFIYNPYSEYEMILRNSGRKPKDYLFVSKSADNIKFLQKSSNKVLDIRI